MRIDPYIADIGTKVSRSDYSDDQWTDISCKLARRGLKLHHDSHDTYIITTDICEEN